MGQDRFAGNEARCDAARGNSHRLLGELPDGDHDTEDESAVHDRFKCAAASFFGTDNESISGFLIVFHKSLLVSACLLMQRSCQPIFYSHKSSEVSDLQFTRTPVVNEKRSALGNFLFRFWDCFLPRVRLRITAPVYENMAPGPSQRA